MSLLGDVLSSLGALPEDEREAVVRMALDGTKDKIWVPNPGPQTDAYFCDADELFYGGSAGGGKGLALDTLLPTPSGWTTMGEVSVGDTLFDEHGYPCAVTAVSAISHRPCYRLRFDDGTEIVADDVHRWVTFNAKELSGDTLPVGTMRDTTEIYHSLTDSDGRHNHAIPYAGSLLAWPATRFRYIVACEPVVSVPTRCISVDSPTRQYLASRAMIPTHNTDLMVGCSLVEHKRALILRRTNKEASKLFDRFRDIIGHRDGWNGQDMVWRMPDGRVIDIGGCQLEDDKQKYKGTPHDLIGFDEISDFTETQYTFITIWNRSADPKQRCRVIAAGNPPTRPEGFWVIKYWAPWLDMTHPNPAKPGELRWFLGGVEVDGPGPHELDGQMVRARSRTFIPARLSDNPDLASTNYDSVLAGLPEALRMAYREGRFDIEADDDIWQVIPTEWVREAQNRWTDRAPPGVPMCAIGVDVAQGGSDKTVVAPRYDGWFSPLVVVPGSQTPLGSDVAGLVMSKRRDGAKVIIDVGGGWGADAYAHLRENQIDAVGYMGVKASVRRTKDRQLRFANVRTEAYWGLREALNPDQPGGSPIMLPNDPELMADLTSSRYYEIPGGIAMEAKDKLIKRIGRSPDRGDAVVMAWWSGAKAVTDGQIWVQDQRRSLGRAPRVIMGRNR